MSKCVSGTSCIHFCRLRLSTIIYTPQPISSEALDLSLAEQLSGLLTRMQYISLDSYLLLLPSRLVTNLSLVFLFPSVSGYELCLEHMQVDSRILASKDEFDDGPQSWFPMTGTLNGPLSCVHEGDR